MSFILSFHQALCALSETPYGIDRETFKKGVARLSVEDDLFVSRVFALVDDDQSNCIEWPEYVGGGTFLTSVCSSVCISVTLYVYENTSRIIGPLLHIPQVSA